MSRPKYILTPSPAPEGAVIPNFRLTQLALDGRLGLIFEDGVSEEDGETMLEEIQKSLSGELDIILSPDSLRYFHGVIIEKLNNWADCQYLVRGLKNEWVLELPRKEEPEAPTHV
jgi:hypothetical protein